MSASSNENAGHVLVVDDDREIRDLLGRFLTKHGYRVTGAQDGKEMRRVLADWNIDLVVLDLMLPGEDGLSLCRDLRARSQIPVIMLTMMGEETDRIIGLEIVADRGTREPAPKERERIVRRAFEKGLLTLPCGKSTIRLSPPLICTDSDADKAVSVLDEVLAEISATS